MAQNRWDSPVALQYKLVSRTRPSRGAEATGEPETRLELQEPVERPIDDVEQGSSGQICSQCQSIRIWELRDPRIRARGHVVHSGMTALRTSARTCPSCKLIAQAVTKSIAFKSWKKTEESFSGSGICLQYLKGQRINITTPEVKDNIGRLCLFAEQGSSALLAGDIKSTPPGRPDGIDRISIWIQICRSQHVRCTNKTLRMTSSPDDLVLLPTRVIDVGPPFSTNQVFLLESEGKRGQYLTLSHRWGDANILRTTSRTLERFKNRIPIETLCQNFQDAMTVTRRLGFRYLWIDSLCIIQDSEEDWNRESRRMADIYLYSTLTISASDALDGNAGFLYRRNPLQDEFAKIPYINRDGVVDGHYYIAPKLRSIFDTEPFPLNRRGWTLQESILARRTVLFGKDQLHWECQSDSWDEGETQFKTLGSKLGGRKLAKLISYGSDTNGLLRFEPWYEIIKQYSDRELTFESDKLPALSGLASSFQRIMGCHYAAGLWEEDLPRGLLWSSGLRKDVFRRPGSPRAPSWSWAGVDGHLEFPFPQGKSQIFDIRVEMEQAGSDPFGKVTSGMMSLRGRIRPVYQSKSQNAVSQKELLSTHMVDVTGLIVGRGQFDTLERYTQIYCLLIRLNLTNDRHSPDSLLLVKDHDAESATYRRIGVFFSNWDEIPSPKTDTAHLSAVPPFFREASLEQVMLV